jgi:hypothetical protein
MFTFADSEVMLRGLLCLDCACRIGFLVTLSIVSQSRNTAEQTG